MEKSNIKVAFCPEHGLQFFDAQSRTCEHIPREENSMEIIDQIHQKLETMDLTPFEKRDLKPLVEQAFRAGKADAADPTAGYSNLTAAIKAGEPIDYEKLGGLSVQCVKPGVGTLRGTLERNESRPADNPAGWWRKGADSLYVSAFIYGWTEHYGWTLWVEGEIPLRRKTADQLEDYVYFLGQARDDVPCMAYVGRPLDISKEKTIYYAPGMLQSITPASEWVVIEEYGPFQKPEGK